VMLLPCHRIASMCLQPSACSDVVARPSSGLPLATCAQNEGNVAPALACVTWQQSDIEFQPQPYQVLHVMLV
jgi:hypothetical protein